jgi:NADPH-dependent curcumin reductase CurA
MQGLLEVWADESHGLSGIEAVPDAVDYMLCGGHIGKVVLRLTGSNV